MHFDLARRLNDKQLEELEHAVRDALAAVRKVVTDFEAMTERVDDMVTVARAGTARYPRDEVHEVADFLEWLLRGNFVLLGAREYDITPETISVIPGSGLGILGDEDRSTFCKPVPLAELPPGIRERATTGDLLWSTEVAGDPVEHPEQGRVGERAVELGARRDRSPGPLGERHRRPVADKAGRTRWRHHRLLP